MRVFVTVSVPCVVDAAARRERARERAAEAPGEHAVCGATVFPVMTLSAIVTVAPVVNPAACGIDTPPPWLTTVSGKESLTPPVIVTPLNRHRRLGPGLLDPIVTTGPPPLMIVFADPAPIRLTLTSIVTPPANVPGAIVIVSPSWAASTAAWIVDEAAGLAADAEGARGTCGGVRCSRRCGRDDEGGRECEG